MKHLITPLLTAAFLTYAAVTQAANVAPLGLEIGVATLAQVKARDSKLTHTGINAWSDGPMLEGDGQALGIDGLEKIHFIFDHQNKLAGVVMTLPKHRFDEVHRYLAGKYRVKSKQIPFVGDRYVRLVQGNSEVEISAPHLSFEMEVRYLGNTLLAAYKTRSQKAEQQRRSEQQEKF